MKPSLALFASAALILGGCASQETTLETEQAYQVDWVGGTTDDGLQPHQPDLRRPGAAPSAMAAATTGSPATPLQDDLLQFGAIGSTRRLCAAEIMEQERRFLALLQSVQHWDISPSDELRLWPAEGKPLRLVPEHD